MSKVHYLIGRTSTQAVSDDQAVLALLPETTRPAAVPTYSRQLYVGAKMLLRLGSGKNIFTAHFLPYMGVVDDNTLGENKDRLELLQTEIDDFSGDAAKRAKVFASYLSANHLIDRTLYPVVEKLRRAVNLTNKDLSPLVEAVYTGLRKTAGATSAHKQKIRAYIQSGEYDSTLTDWLTRLVDPRFSLFQEVSRLERAVQEREKRNGLTKDPALEREFCQAVEELAAGQSSNREIHGVNIDHWLEEMVGCKIQSSFFAEIREIRQGLTKNGCLVLASLKNVTDLNEPGTRLIPLDKFCCFITALDRALSVVVMEYAHATPEVQSLFDGHIMHSGLLIRAFLGESDAIRTMYPKHIVGIPNKPELDEAAISKARQAFGNGQMAQVCSKSFGMDEQTLQVGMEKAVSVQQKILPLLPVEIHHFVDVLETRIRLRKKVESLEASGKQSMTEGQLRNLRTTVNVQNLRGQQITKRLKADFRIDLAKMFCLDGALIDEMEELFGRELGFLRPVLAKYIDRGPDNSSSALKKGNQAEES